MNNKNNSTFPKHLMMFNIRSWNSNYDAFRDYFQTEINDSEVIHLCEAWKKLPHTDYRLNKNFQPPISIHRDGTLGGGLASIYANGISFSKLNKFCFIEENIEVLTSKVNNGNFKGIHANKKDFNKKT